MKVLAGDRLDLTEDSDEDQAQHGTSARHDEGDEGSLSRWERSGWLIAVTLSLYRGNVGNRSWLEN